MSLLEEYQLFRRILALCPCCGELRRVSDLRLKSKAKAVKTWLDKYDSDSQQLAYKELAFGEQEEKLRQEAIEKGRKKAEKAFIKALCPSLRKLKLNPYDVKPIFHPIDFIAFNGMTTQEEISDILLLAREQCAMLDPIRKQIKKAVNAYKYEWQVARIDDSGNIRLE
jgi:predicted Holliday junction resolvase-like endonuclease